MRLLLAAASLSLLATHAYGEEDRYGPSRAAPPMAAAGVVRTSSTAGSAAYSGPFLTWAGKVEPGGRPSPPPPLRPPPQAPAMTTPPAPAYPPMQVRRDYAPRPAEPQNLYSPPPRRDAVAAPPAEMAAPPPAPRPSPPPRPAAMAAAPAPAQPAAPAPRAAPPPPPATAPTGEPRRPWANLGGRTSDDPPPAAVAASAPARPAQASAATAAPATGGVRGGRFYSLHRDFGDTPDPIPTPQANPPVLIGPDQATTSTTTPPDFAAGGVGDNDPTPPPPRPRQTPAQSTASH